MNDLLQVAVDAHGGLSRWNQLKTVKTSLSITGAIWQIKGKPDMRIHVSNEALTCPLPSSVEILTPDPAWVKGGRSLDQVGRNLGQSAGSPTVLGMLYDWKIWWAW